MYRKAEPHFWRGFRTDMSEIYASVRSVTGSNWAIQVLGCRALCAGPRDPSDRWDGAVPDGKRRQAKCWPILGAHLLASTSTDHEPSAASRYLTTGQAPSVVFETTVQVERVVGS